MKLTNPINQLKYLDIVIKEALRFFSASILERVCDKTYKLPPALPGEKSFTVHKDMIIWIPLYAIHNVDVDNQIIRKHENIYYYQ